MSGRKKSRDVSARRRKALDKGRVPWSYVIPSIIIVAVIVGVIYINFRPGPNNGGGTTVPYGSYNFPAGINCLGTEGLFLHIHPWLRIVINGQNVTIPAGIGIENPIQEGQAANGVLVYGAGPGGCYAPVHTHDDTGIIHIESPTNTNYTLGEFFGIWAASYQYALVNGKQEPIVFNNTDILGFKVNSSSHSLKLLVNGQAAPVGDFQSSPSDYTNLVLNVLDYCNSANAGASSSPCYSSVNQVGNPSAANPAWNGGGGYPYQTGQTIEIVYS